MPLLLALGLWSCGGAEPDGVSYARDIQPLLDRHCVYCHNSANQTGLPDLEDPFSRDTPPGMVGEKNAWEEGHPGNSPEFDIAPFRPEDSFILEKVSNQELLPGACPPAPAHCRQDDVGQFMPAQQPRLSAEQIATIRQWITDGALDDDFFRTSVAPIFGNPLSAQKPYPCGYCHYPGSPNPPDFSQPFDPVVGIVGVTARYRTDLKLVEPGDPDASFLVMKIEAEEPRSDIGSPMPRNFAPLSEAQVATLQQWIAEGAQNN